MTIIESVERLYIKKRELNPNMGKINKERGHGSFEPGKILLQSLLIIGLEVLFGGIWALKDLSYIEWQSEVQNFQWLVLVKGDVVTVDEVGRFLTGINGVKEAQLISKEQILDRLQKEELWPEDAGKAGIDFLPHTWLVTWKENPSALEDQKSTIEDIKNLSGVIDVAFDSRGQERIRGWRQFWLTSRLIMGALIVLTILIFGLIVGKWLVSSRLKLPPWKKAVTDIGLVFIPWAAGYFLSALLFGFVPVIVLVGGLVIGVGQLIWAQTRLS